MSDAEKVICEMLFDMYPSIISIRSGRAFKKEGSHRLPRVTYLELEEGTAVALVGSHGTIGEVINGPLPLRVLLWLSGFVGGATMTGWNMNKKM